MIFFFDVAAPEKSRKNRLTVTWSPLKPQAHCHIVAHNAHTPSHPLTTSPFYSLPSHLLPPRAPPQPHLVCCSLSLPLLLHLPRLEALLQPDSLAVLQDLVREAQQKKLRGSGNLEAGVAGRVLPGTGQWLQPDSPARLRKQQQLLFAAPDGPGGQGSSALPASSAPPAASTDAVAPPALLSLAEPAGLQEAVRAKEAAEQECAVWKARAEDKARLLEGIDGLMRGLVATRQKVRRQKMWESEAE